MALTNHLDNGTQLIKHSLIIGLVHFVLPTFWPTFLDVSVSVSKS